MDFAETQILNESETGFNLTVFYGKDAEWPNIINACRRYPMFAERQVVLLKEAQQMRDIEKLEAYIENPLHSTIFVVSYKEKKVDGRTRLAKLLKERGVVLTTKKLYDNQLPEWTDELVQSKDHTISSKALMLLVDHIGNDLSRIENEIDKILINLSNRKTITEEDVEKYVGVSKDFNVFELQAALATKNLPKAIQIIQYFEANPKVAPIQLILPSLYSFFSKVFMIYGLNTRDENGKFSNTTDLSNMVGLLKQTGGDEVGKLKNTDTTISLAGVADSIAGLTPQQKKIIDQGNMKLSLNMNDEKLIINLNLPFKKISDIPMLKEALPKVSEAVIKKLPGTEQMPAGMS